MAFGIFTMLCNHHLCLVSKHFYYLKIKSMPIKQLLPISPSAQTTTSLLSVFMLLLILAISCEQKYVTFHAWLISLSIMFWRFIHTVVHVSTSFFYGWIIFHCMYRPQFVYLLIHWWTFRLLSFVFFGGPYQDIFILWLLLIVCCYEYVCTCTCF